MKPEDELCDQLTAGLEAAMAKAWHTRQIAHSIMPIVLAYETRARADERAKVAEEIEAQKTGCEEHPMPFPKPSCWTCGRDGAFHRAARIARGEA